jgi:two-component system alkaline phosphatase synthesis response regulator PhoP
MNASARHILLVEDEPGLVLTLTDRLRREGFEVTAASDGYAAGRIGLQGHFDLILLDIMLPGQSGFEVCTELRRRDARTPILMLTACGAVEDRVRGLRLGADDYLQKPFEMSELLARIGALLRRAAPIHRQLSLGRARVDFDAGTVTANGESIDVSAQCLRLLEFLVEHGGQTITRDTLLAKVVGAQVHALYSNRAYARRLAAQAARTGPGPRHIVTLHDAGYRFDP